MPQEEPQEQDEASLLAPLLDEGVEGEGEAEEEKTFESMGMHETLCKVSWRAARLLPSRSLCAASQACYDLKWKRPTKIQSESIPVALQVA